LVAGCAYRDKKVVVVFVRFRANFAWAVYLARTPGQQYKYYACQQSYGCGRFGRICCSAWEGTQRPDTVSENRTGHVHLDTAIVDNVHAVSHGTKSTTCHGTKSTTCLVALCLCLSVLPANAWAKLQAWLTYCGTASAV
jgi:hypothetical protein